MPGKSKAGVETELVGVRMPVGAYREMMGVIETDRKWPKPTRQNFILEAIKEKIDRWRAEGHTVVAGPLPGDEPSKRGRAR